MVGTRYVTRQVAALLDYAKSTLIEHSRRLVSQSSAGRTALDREAVTELIRLTDNLLRQYGRDIEEVEPPAASLPTNLSLLRT